MSDTIPPWVIKNDKGEYRSMTGWTRHRSQAVSFDTDVDARAWIEATPALMGYATRDPFDADREQHERAGLGLRPSVPLTSNAHEYDPVR